MLYSRSALLVQATRSLRPHYVPTRVTRTFQSSAPVLRKKAKVAVNADVEEDPFESTGAEDDLFGGSSSNTSASASATTNAATRTLPSETAPSTRRPDTFQKEYTHILEQTTPSEGTKVKQHVIRKSAIRNLLRWVDSGEQLERVVALLENVRRSGHQQHELTAVEFFGRCVNLRRPDLALQVLTQRPKYGLDLPNTALARDLLHSIFVRALAPTPTDATLAASAKPFTNSHHGDALLLAELYPHFKLGTANQDPVSATLLTSLFLQTKGAVDVSTGVEEMKSADVARSFAEGLHRVEVAPSTPHRHKVWLRTELQKRKVTESLSKWGVPVDALVAGAAQ